MKQFLILVFFITLIQVSSCKKWLGDNIDHATPQQAPAHILLPPMFDQVARGLSADARYIGRYTQNWGISTSNDAVERHGYVRNSDALGEIWRTVYYGLGSNINLLFDDASAAKKWEFMGAGNAIRAWGWQTATDYHGELILKQAFEDNRYQFEYDSQEEVYAEVVRLCNQALQYFEKTDGMPAVASNFTTADLVYKGEVIKWKRFVNGLLARNAHNLANKPGYDPDKVIAFVNKALSANTDNFIIPFDGKISNSSSYYGPARIPTTFPSLNGTYIQGNMIAQLLNGNVFNGVRDPRVSLMLYPSKDGVYRGVQPGQADPNRHSSNTVINNTEIPNIYGIKSGVNPTLDTSHFLFRNTTGLPVMTYAEMLFIKAEAAFKKGDKAVAYDAFKNGIAAHMNWVGVSAANRDAYMTSAAIPATENDLALKDILLQKYIALWGHGMVETWNDMRRYDYDTTLYSRYTLFPDPSLQFGTLFEDNMGKLAYRARPRYNSEYLWNVDALRKIGAMDIDYHTKKPWFIMP
jgi:hypothetical protein